MSCTRRDRPCWMSLWQGTIILWIKKHIPDCSTLQPNLSKKDRREVVPKVSTVWNKQFRTFEAFHLNLFQKTGRKEDDFYGVLFEVQDHYVHILEGTKDSIFDYLRMLEKTLIDDNFLQEFDYKISAVKILYYSDDVGSLSFPRWTCREIPNVAHQDNDDEDLFTAVPLSKEEEKAGLVWILKIQELLTQLLALGKKVMGLGIRQMSLFLDGLNQNFPHLVPKESYIKEILKDCKHCLTLSEMLEVYDRPITLDLSGENVW